jgi:hypothetical protein
MKLRQHLATAITALALTGGSQAIADQYRYANVSPDTYNHAYQPREQFCGALLIPGWKWSNWYYVDSECGVQLEVRYRMKYDGSGGARTFLQLRYINATDLGRTATVSNVGLHFHDGHPDLVWNGEQIYVPPGTTRTGMVQSLEGRLCTWNKRYTVR